MLLMTTQTNNSRTRSNSLSFRSRTCSDTPLSICHVPRYSTPVLRNFLHPLPLSRLSVAHPHTAGLSRHSLFHPLSFTVSRSRRLPPCTLTTLSHRHPHSPADLHSPVFPTFIVRLFVRTSGLLLQLAHRFRPSQTCYPAAALGRLTQQTYMRA